jgi:hypothetical protein
LDFGGILTDAAVVAIKNCPPPLPNDPCTCNLAQVSCQGVNVTKDRINNMFQRIRMANPVPPKGDSLGIAFVFIIETRMKSVELTPFLDFSFDAIFVWTNPQLSRIFLEHSSQTDKNKKEGKGEEDETRDPGFNCSYN